MKFTHVDPTGQTRTTIAVGAEFVEIARAIKVPTTYGKTRFRVQESIVIDTAAFDELLARRGLRP